MTTDYVIRRGVEGRERLRILARVLQGSTTALFDRLGVAGDLRCLDVGCGEQELGYTFDPAYWGHGYASEAARCVFEYARDVLRPPCMVSAIHPDNVRSLRVAERFGLRRDGRVEILGREFDRYLWPRSAPR